MPFDGGESSVDVARAIDLRTARSFRTPRASSLTSARSLRLWSAL